MTRTTETAAPFHRKFIALILAAAMSVTGFAAGPARADSEDIAKFIAGVAVLGIIGAAINDHKDNRRRPPHVDPTPRPKPLPPRVRRYDLPSQCLTSLRVRGQTHRIVGLGCLHRSYDYTRDLPNSCYTELGNREQRRRGYRPNCLRQHGYRLVRG
ncbi:hypothetical protein [Phaeobacter sp. B1627]|uniref:hypothetical protein n=1 Tax=Phaeobacter sp. B1627 TaxID=2583809 RepID=UPI00111894AA|nr:hypothetical protein [Phaeobacter sp. B1627]TNJ46295.1 hypothetical protein FGE21_05735 [Phaeobacter sp. B1627]